MWKTVATCQNKYENVKLTTDKVDRDVILQLQSIQISGSAIFLRYFLHV